MVCVKSNDIITMCKIGLEIIEEILFLNGLYLRERELVT